jgi:adenylate kinase
MICAHDVPVTTRRLIILGPPGSGKGTQARILAERLGLAHLSVGALLRAEIAAGTDLGNRIVDQVESGDLVADEDVVRVLRKPLDAAETETGWILDGAPRTVTQAQLLAPIVEHDSAKVIALDVPEGELRQRLLARAEQQDRADDTPEVVDHRLAVWATEGAPLLDWYGERGMLVMVDGTGDVAQIAERVAAVAQ